MTFKYAGTARGTVSVLRGTLVLPDRMGGDVPENAEDVLEASLKDVDPLVVPEDSKTTIRFVKIHGRKGEKSASAPCGWPPCPANAPTPQV